MNRFLKIALVAFVAYLALAYYAGSNFLLDPSYSIKPLPTYSGAPRGLPAPIGTPDPDSVNSHGVLEAVHPTDWFGNQFYPLGDGYTNNTSYPLLTNNYPI